MRTHSSAILSLPILLLLAACSEAPKEAKKEPPKPLDPVTGQVAFHRMYLAAKNWAPDAQGIQVTSVPLKSIPAADGKYPAWRGRYVSESKRGAKSFTWAAVQEEGLFKGVFGGPDESYSGPSGQTMPFIIQSLKIDTDAALKTALEKGKGDEYSKKFPDKPIHFILEYTKRFPNPTWRVVWGESVGTSNFSVFVDATTGDYLQTMR